MRRLIVIVAGVGLTMIGAIGIASPPPAAADGTTLFVAPTGSTDTANDCRNPASPCKTVGHAISQATSDTTIQLAPGKYFTNDNPPGTANVLGPDLHDVTIESEPVGGTPRNTTIDATGRGGLHPNSSPIALVVNANNVTVRNLTITNAELQGILVAPPDDAVTPAAITGFTLTDAAVKNNDRCDGTRSEPETLPPPTPLSGAGAAAVDICSPTRSDAYGHGVQLKSAVGATITNNDLSGNAGGVLVTDELGPSHGNLISHNTFDSSFTANGVTLAGKNTNGVATSGPNAGRRQPSLGGIYDNTISHNFATQSLGSGFRIVGHDPGNAVYDNTIELNQTDLNRRAGVTVYSLSAHQDINGNVIEGNTLNRDAYSTTGISRAGDPLAGDFHTTGIVVYSSTAPITGTVVKGNTITQTVYGVWMSAHIPNAVVSDNNAPVFAGGTRVVAKSIGAPPVLGIATTHSGNGYWQVDGSGGVHPFEAAFPSGDAGWYGSLAGLPLARPIAGMAATPAGHGYWLVATDGGIFSFGDAHFYGSTGAIHLNKPIVGMAATPTGNGYWLVASDGGIFSYGDAHFYGSTGALHLNKPIVGMASTSTGHGYWLVASDGGIFAFGDARFHGSTGAIHLNKPIVGMAATQSGNGYWLVATDGGIFAFGDAHFFGSTGAIRLAQPITGMAATPTGNGYWFTAADGGIFSYGDAHYYGSEAAGR